MKLDKLLVAFTLLTSFSLVSCGEKKKEENKAMETPAAPAPAETPATPTETPAPPAPVETPSAPAETSAAPAPTETPAETPK